MSNQKIKKTSNDNKKSRNFFRTQREKLVKLKNIGILSVKEFEIHTFYLQNLKKSAKGLIKDIKKKSVKNINEKFYKKIFVHGQVGLEQLENFNQDDLLKPISEALVNFVHMVKFMCKRKNEIINEQTSNPHIVRHHNEISFIKMLNEISKILKNSINEIRASKCTLRTNSGLIFVNSDFAGKIYDKYLSEEIILTNLSKSFTNKNIESTLLVMTFKEEETVIDDKKAKRSLGDENQLYEEIHLPHNLPLTDNNLVKLSLENIKNVPSNVDSFYPTLPTFLLVSVLLFWIYRFLKK